MRKIYLPITVLFCALSFFGFAQDANQLEPVFRGQVSSVEYVAPMSERPQDLVAPDDTPREAHDKRSIAQWIEQSGTQQDQDDALVRFQEEVESTSAARNATLSYDAYSSTSQPTDPSLAIGPNHVFVVYNTGFAIYDKAGNQLQGPTSPNPAIFPSGGCCDLTVSYDNAADRWVLSFLGSGAQIAVSDGPNPVTSGWFIYTIAAISDYQKLSVWSDGYYITENTGGSNKVWALERAEMLAGNANAQVLGFALPGLVTSGFFSPQVLNCVDGNLPASGGATVVYMQDDAWAGVNSDHIKVWTIDVDWNNTNNSSISNPSQVPVTSFISVFDNGSFSNLAQPGGVSIDALQATMMNQAQFKKFASYNAAVFNFVVDTEAGSAERAGVRWMEFRQNGDNQPWSLYQEGTYVAPNGRHAWNASMAIDASGNIGMGYTSMSGPTTPTTVRVSSYYTGRLNGDPLGVMTVAEGLIANGNGNIPGTRYGDYAKLDVDPSNGSDFWFITEYWNSGRKGVVGKFDLGGTPPPADTEAPTNPNNLVASNVTTSSASLTWNASSDNVGVTAYTISINGTAVGTSSTPNFTVTGLNPETTYTASVNASDAAGNTSGSASTSFTTGVVVATYCASASTNVNDEYISRVQLNTIDNASGAQFYSDFTNVSTDLTQGETYTVTVTPTWTGTVYAEGYAVWIDYNGDADFNDAGELVWSKAASTDTPNSGTFTVPTNTALVATRMRVSMKYNGTPTACETFTYGEVEDYTVVLGQNTGDTQAPSTPLNLSASGTTTTTTDLAWSASTDNVGVVGYNVFMDGTNLGTTTGAGAGITSLLPNTSYSFAVSAFDAAGNTSALSNAVTITTLDDNTGGGTAGEIGAYYFETSLDGWIDGGSDCARITSSAVSFEGSRSVRLRDNSSSSNMRSPILDLSEQTEISIEHHIWSSGMENGEDYFIEFFNGSSYQVVGNYARGTDFNNSEFFSPAPIVLSANDYNFNTNNRFRIRCDASVNNDRIYVDQVIIRGDNVAREAAPAVQLHDPAAESVVELQQFAETLEENVKIFPNPAQSVLNIEIADAYYDNIVVFASTGQVVYESNGGENQIRIDVSGFTPGMYFVRFISNGQATTKRFIKK